MTHTLHRQGTAENLANDYLVIALPNPQLPDFMEKMERFYQICLKHNPVNYRSSVAWRIYVFDSEEKVTSVLKDIIEAQLGLSIVVSGLYDKVEDCCNAVGIKPHNINYSLGFWGNRAKLPPTNIAEITTMCGHGLISPNLVYYMAERVAKGLPVADAADEIAKCCICDIVNTARCKHLLSKLAEDIRCNNRDISKSP